MASLLPLDDTMKLELLKINCSIQRLRYELSVMKRVGKKMMPRWHHIQKFSCASEKFLYYSIIRLYRTRLYRNSAYIEVQSAVPPDTMLISTKDARLYRTRFIQNLGYFEAIFQSLSIKSLSDISNMSRWLPQQPLFSWL